MSDKNTLNPTNRIQTNPQGNCNEEYLRNLEEIYFGLDQTTQELMTESITDCLEKQYFTVERLIKPETENKDYEITTIIDNDYNNRIKEYNQNVITTIIFFSQERVPEKARFSNPNSRLFKLFAGGIYLSKESGNDISELINDYNQNAISPKGEHYTFQESYVTPYKK